MSRHIENINWLQELSYRGVFNSECFRVTRACLEEGGFISGGFARKLARSLLIDRHESVHANETWHQTIDWYSACRNLNNYSPPWAATRHVDVRDPTARYQWRGGVGDIDIFFHTEQRRFQATDAINRCIEAGWKEIIHIGKSPAGFAEEYIVEKRPFQLVSKLYGTPEQIVDSFDFTNAKVWLDAEGIHYTDEWLELEKNNLLGIDQWDRPSLLWRVHKWTRKHHLRDLREGDHAKYVDAVYKAMELVKSGECVRWGQKIRPSQIKEFAKAFIYTSPITEVLKASMLLDSYDQMTIMNEISKKGLKNDKR